MHGLKLCVMRYGMLAADLAWLLQGLVAIPMSEVIHRKRLKDTFQLDAAKHGQLQLELRWMSVLQSS